MLFLWMFSVQRNVMEKSLWDRKGRWLSGDQGTISCNLMRSVTSPLLLHYFVLEGTSDLPDYTLILVIYRITTNLFPSTIKIIEINLGTYHSTIFHHNYTSHLTNLQNSKHGRILDRSLLMTSSLRHIPFSHLKNISSLARISCGLVND